MDRFDALSKAFCASPKGQALLDDLAARPPWRRSWRLPYWLYFAFCRRWILSLNVSIYCACAVRDPWVLLIAGAAAILFEARVVRRAADLQMSDRAFVEFVLDGSRFQAPGGDGPARAAWRRLLILMALGFAVAVPLWWLARMHTHGPCADPGEDRMLCSLAAPGADAFRIWFGFLLFAPLAYLSPRIPGLLLFNWPSQREERPALLHWWWDEPLPRPFDWRTAVYIYFFAPFTHGAFALIALALGGHTNLYDNLVFLLGAFIIGSLFPLVTMGTYAQWKGWMTVCAFLETDYSRKRTELLRA